MGVLCFAARAEHFRESDETDDADSLRKMRSWPAMTCVMRDALFAALFGKLERILHAFSLVGLTTNQQHLLHGGNASRLVTVCHVDESVRGAIGETLARHVAATDPERWMPGTIMDAEKSLRVNGN